MKNSTFKTYYKRNKSKSPLIIFIHGAACDHTIWLYQSRFFFNKNFSTLTIDLPGHGRNKTKPSNSVKVLSNLLKKLIKKLSHKEIYLVGHSMGSLICMDVALSNLHVIKKIFLIGISYPMRVNKELLNKSKINQDLAIKDMIEWSLPDRIKLNGSNLIGTDLPNLINVVMSNSKKGILYNDLSACNNYILDEKKIGKVKTPIIIINSESDMMTPYKSALCLKNMFINAELQIVKDSGHFYTLENPLELNKIIEKNLINSEKENRI